MCERVPLPFIKNMRKCTTSISTPLQFRCRHCTTKSVDKLHLKYPHNIHKVPIKNPQIKSNRLSRFCCRQQKQTYPQIEETYDNVKSVEASSKVESTPKNAVTKSKPPSGILQILTIHKKQSKENSVPQLQFAKIFLVIFQCVFCSICCKITPQQQQSVDFRKSIPLNRNNSQRRPTHSYLNCRHQRPMQKCPQQTNKEHCFRPNELHHTKVQSIFYFPCMKTKHTFTMHITPPYSCSVSNCRECEKNKSSPSSILMEKQNHRKKQPKNTKPSQCWPGARINQMIAVVRPISTPSPSRHFCSIFDWSRILTVLFIQSHIFKEK